MAFHQQKLIIFILAHIYGTYFFLKQKNLYNMKMRKLVCKTVFVYDVWSHWMCVLVCNDKDKP